jgi:hypothetical protein
MWRNRHSPAEAYKRSHLVALRTTKISASGRGRLMKASLQ